MSPFDAEYEPSPWQPVADEVERYERTDGAAASDDYQAATDRQIPLFVLDPVDG